MKNSQNMRKITKHREENLPRKKLLQSHNKKKGFREIF